MIIQLFNDERKKCLSTHFGIKIFNLIVLQSKTLKKKKYNEYGIGEDYTPSSLEDRCKTNTGVTQTQL